MIPHNRIIDTNRDYEDLWKVALAEKVEEDKTHCSTSGKWHSPRVAGMQLVEKKIHCTEVFHYLVSFCFLMVLRKEKVKSSSDFLNSGMYMDCMYYSLQLYIYV